MIILIADSGSTKSDWLAIDEEGNELRQFSTMGFNPYFHNSDLVEAKMNESPEAMEIASDIDRVYFYGAGSSSEVLCEIIAKGLQRVFSKAQVHVGHDTSIGKNCLFAAQVGIAGCVTIEDDVTLWGQVGIPSNVIMKKGSTALGQSGILKNTEEGKTYLGSPAKEARAAFKEMALLKKLP